jgi:hypothetical protein
VKGEFCRCTWSHLGWAHVHQPKRLDAQSCSVCQEGNQHCRQGSHSNITEMVSRVKRSR